MNCFTIVQNTPNPRAHQSFVVEDELTRETFCRDLSGWSLLRLGIPKRIVPAVVEANERWRMLMRADNTIKSTLERAAVAAASPEGVREQNRELACR